MDSAFKEHKMSVLSLRIDGTVAVVESITKAVADAFGDNTEQQIIAPIAGSLPATQRKKVLEIRRQLARDTYDIDERLDLVLERILMDIP
jgi:hypothetical protein